MLNLKKLNFEETKKKLTCEEDLDKVVVHYLNTGRIRRDHQKVTSSLSYLLDPFSRVDLSFLNASTYFPPYSSRKLDQI